MQLLLFHWLLGEGDREKKEGILARWVFVHYSFHPSATGCRSVHRPSRYRSHEVSLRLPSLQPNSTNASSAERHASSGRSPACKIILDLTGASRLSSNSVPVSLMTFTSCGRNDRSVTSQIGGPLLGPASCWRCVQV